MIKKSKFQQNKTKKWFQNNKREKTEWFNINPSQSPLAISGPWNTQNKTEKGEIHLLFILLLNLELPQISNLSHPSFMPV